MSAMASQVTGLTIVYSTVYSGADHRNFKAPCHWPVCVEFTGEFPAQMASNAENISIWWRHHVEVSCVDFLWHVQDSNPGGPGTPSQQTCEYKPSELSRVKLTSSWPSDAIWRHRSGSTLVQVMACCLTAPNHYLNQCWLPISEVFWHSPDSNFLAGAEVTILYNDFKICDFKISATKRHRVKDMKKTSQQWTSIQPMYMTPLQKVDRPWL